MAIRMSICARLSKKLCAFFLFAVSKLPGGNSVIGTRGTQVPIDCLRYFSQKVLGINGDAYWPMHPTSTVSYPHRIRIGIETSPGHSPSCMIHGVNGIIIGDYTQISQNVAILSGNHDPYELRSQLPSPPVKIGRYCLLGFNSVILPGVELGDFTIVGANSVVTQSFPAGYCVVAGSPARAVRYLNREEAKFYQSSQEYIGYIRACDFALFARRHLDPLVLSDKEFRGDI